MGWMEAECTAVKIKGSVSSPTYLTNFEINKRRLLTGERLKEELAKTRRNYEVTCEAQGDPGSSDSHLDSILSSRGGLPARQLSLLTNSSFSGD